jgi:uncharacterized protein YaaQ
MHTMPVLAIDRLAWITTSGSQAEALLKALMQAGFAFTIVDSTSGLAAEAAETCLLTGFPSARLPELLGLVREHCQPYMRFVPAQGFLSTDMANQPMIEARLGGAWFYLMTVEHFEQF